MKLLNGGVLVTLILFTSTVQGFHYRNATTNQFPYHAHIVVYERHTRWRWSTSTLEVVRSCSGAVLTPHFVITAYRCVRGQRIFRIILGNLSPDRADDNGTYNQITEEKVYHSPSNSSISFKRYDTILSLIQVKKEIDPTSSASKRIQ